MITGFAGRSFEFLGQPGAYYNLISEKDHEVSLLTGPAVTGVTPPHHADVLDRAGNCFFVDTARMHAADVADIARACAQVSTKLKVGVMWDHNGTYMEGFAFQYKDQRVVIQLTADDQLFGACL